MDLYRHEATDLEAATGDCCAPADSANAARSNSQQADSIELAGTAADDDDQEKSTNSTKTNIEPTEYKLSPQRWLILFVIAISGLLGSATSQFSTILRVMQELLELSRNNYVHLGQLFLTLPALTSVPTAWFIDKYGLKTALYTAALLTTVRHSFRALLFMPHLDGWQHFKLIYWIVSGIFNAQIGAIFMCLPLKVSENWFARSERSFAWTVMYSSLDVGSTIAALTYPRIVASVDDVEPLAYFNLVAMLVVAVIVPAFVTRSEPKYPPSARMQSKKSARQRQNPKSIVDRSKLSSPSWLGSLGEILRQRQIMLHLIHRTMFSSLAISAAPLMQEILVASGHSEIFVGDLVALSSLVSVLMLMTLSTLVHLVKDITMACKLASLAESLIYVAHLLTLLYRVDEWIIMAISVCFMVAKSWKQPNFNEMTGLLINGSSISEATISSVGITLFVLMTNVTQIVFVRLIKQRLHDGSPDYTDSITATSVVCLLNSLAYFILFEGPTKSKISTEHKKNSIELTVKVNKISSS